MLCPKRSPNGRDKPGERRQVIRTGDKYSALFLGNAACTDKVQFHSARVPLYSSFHTWFLVLLALPLSVPKTAQVFARTLQ